MSSADALALALQQPLAPFVQELQTAVRSFTAANAAASASSSTSPYQAHQERSPGRPLHPQFAAAFQPPPSLGTPQLLNTAILQGDPDQEIAALDVAQSLGKNLFCKLQQATWYGFGRDDIFFCRNVLAVFEVSCSLSAMRMCTCVFHKPCIRAFPQPLG
eukprot:TRINITY_DN4845_c0_g2_i4.p1 TRINITY_DN4845_c0_g2~~TRINITY_DN4845_c0_g2_i4.p1  ORF type:complete len:160 (+),score=15.40 TRINITY_DN4845_c0_g2_i4:264-743(+)